MSTPFLGELKICAFAFAPKGWAMCNGQLLPINQNQALFSILGTTYGGDGQVNFALPNLRGRTPIHAGGASNFTQGQTGGQEAHTVTLAEMPTHTHMFNVSQANATVPVPTGNTYGGTNNGYAAATNLVQVLPETVTNTGGSQPHENRQPYLVLNIIIALQGIFPSRN